MCHRRDINNHIVHRSMCFLGLSFVLVYYLNGLFELALMKYSLFYRYCLSFHAYQLKFNFLLVPQYGQNKLTAKCKCVTIVTVHRTGTSPILLCQLIQILKCSTVLGKMVSDLIDDGTVCVYMFVFSQEFYVKLTLMIVTLTPATMRASV